MSSASSSASVASYDACDNCGMLYERDVRAFDERAASYESGVLGQLHRDISSRVADLALSLGPAPDRRWWRSPMKRATDERVRFFEGTAERLPAGDGRYDLVVSTTSFDHWADQAAGIAECARVLAPGGHLVLADQFSLLLWPTLVAGRRGKARTRARATCLVVAAGLRSPRWHLVAAVIIQAVTAVKQARFPTRATPVDSAERWRFAVLRTPA